MDQSELRKFIHDFRNALNAANISANHLDMNAQPDTKPIIERLERALDQAAQLVREFESKLQGDATPK